MIMHRESGTAGKTDEGGNTTMYIMDDGIRLNAKLEKPDVDRCPLVIVIHGFTGHMEEEHLVAVSRMLNENGFATLRVDMYGHGKSEGQFRDHTLYKWLTNAMTVIDYARSLEFVTDLYLCGHSQGGLTVILAAALKHDVIKGLIALAPACMIPELARTGGLLGTRFDPDHIPEEMTVWDSHVLGNNYVRVAQTIHVEEAIDRYNGPVLIVQGEKDGEDLKASAIAAAERYRDCRFVMIPEDMHCFNVHMDQMVRAVQEWILERNGAKQGR